MTVIPRFAASASAEDIAQALQTVGCVIIENLAPVDLLDQILAEMAPYIDATPYGSEDFTGRTTKRTGALLARSRASVDLVAHPLILDITQKILGPYADTFQLHLTQIINIGPGSQAQGLHRDQWCFNMFPFPADMDVEVSTIWALDDFTEENGATRVIPNSLNDPPTAIEDNHRTVGATMPKGSVVIYTGRTQRVPVVPRDAVLMEAGRPYVFVQISGESFARRPITVASRDGDLVGIRSGVMVGDRVVTIGAYDVQLASAATGLPAEGHVH